MDKYEAIIGGRRVRADNLTEVDLRGDLSIVLIMIVFFVWGMVIGAAIYSIWLDSQI